MSINSVNISGNLTRDAELKVTQSRTAVLRIGVAVNDRRKNPQTDQWEDVPNFIDCSMFGTRAEKIAPYLTKGTKVAISGRLRYHSWTDQQGGKRSSVGVVVDEIEFMSRGQQQGYQPAQAAPMAAPVQAAPVQADLYAEDCPF